MAQSSHAGRASSWLAVSVMWIGFIVGGIAFVPHPKWWLFWTGTGIVAIGGFIALAVHIFDDVILDGPRMIPEERHHSELSGTRGQISAPQTATDPATTRHHG